MAFIAAPRVLLIDELSLGLAPVIVGQLLPIVRRLADDGVAVVLVEQSVNVALTVAERAYFMERGRIRFSGPTAELLARPDLLRSVFLSEASVGVMRTRRAARSSTSAAAADASALAVADLSCSFGGIRAVDEVSFQVAGREIVGIIGPNGAGKTTLFDLISGFTPGAGGSIVLGGRRRHRVDPAAACVARPRSQLPGCPAVPGHDGARDVVGRAGTLVHESQCARRQRCGCPWCSTTKSAPRCASTS